MRKFLTTLLVLVLLSGQCFGADIVDWIRGDGTDAIKGADNVSDIDYDSTNYLQDPLDRLLTYYIHGCTLTYATAATVTVGVGEVTCSNGAGTVKRMRKNTATTTITLPASGAAGGSLDTGNAAISTWYHIYAIADADATTFTVICSASATNPTGASYLYYRYLGSFYNNAADNIGIFYWFGNGEDITVMWDIPVNITTAVSAGAWSGATSCAVAIPSTSTLGIFGLRSEDADTGAGTWIRPSGSTWTSNEADGVTHVTGGGIVHVAAGQRLCATDSTQQIQYYNHGSDDSTSINVEGYQFKR